MMAITGGAAADAAAPVVETGTPAEPASDKQPAVVEERTEDSKAKRAVGRKQRIPYVLQPTSAAPTTSWSTTGAMWAGFNARTSSTRPAKKTNRLHVARKAKCRRRRAQRA